MSDRLEITKNSDGSLHVEGRAPVGWVDFDWERSIHALAAYLFVDCQVDPELIRVLTKEFL